MTKFDSLKSITLKLKGGIDIPVSDTATERPATDAINSYEEGRTIRVPRAEDGGHWITKPEMVIAIIEETSGTTSDYSDDNCQNI